MNHTPRTLRAMLAVALLFAASAFAQTAAVPAAPSAPPKLSAAIPPKPAPAPERWRPLIGDYRAGAMMLYVLEEGETHPLPQSSRKPGGSNAAKSGAPRPANSGVPSPAQSGTPGAARSGAPRLVVAEPDGAHYALEELRDGSFRFPQAGRFANANAAFNAVTGGVARQLFVGQQRFDRADPGRETFRITPQRPVRELIDESLRAQPPAETGDFRPADLVELASLDPSIHLDVRYATSNNFLATPVYSQARVFLQRPAAEALLHANRKLHARGYGLLIHDAYRPWYVTRVFWEATPLDKKVFVADPRTGSRHNRGCAVDLTIYDLKTGKPIEMPGVYDEMSERSYPGYPGGTSLERWHRDLLRRAMEAEGFTVFEAEWWHFDFRDWKNYRIGNVRFEEIQK